MAASVTRSARAATSRSKAPHDAADATYLYCLVHGRRAPSARGVPAGVPRSRRPRILAVDRHLWAVVSSVPIASFSEAAIERGLKDLTWVSECAVGHERVVEHFLRRGTVVPMKLFTIFTSDARALDHLVRERQTIDRLIQRLEDRVEFGVRVSLMQPAAIERASPIATTGAEYLRAKRSLRDAAIELSGRAQERVEEIFDQLSAIASESVRRPILETNPAGGRVLLDAAYLVSRKASKRFEAAVRALARTFSRDGYHITLTGPWPGYNFVGERP